MGPSGFGAWGSGWGSPSTANNHFFKKWMKECNSSRKHPIPIYMNEIYARFPKRRRGRRRKVVCFLSSLTESLQILLAKCTCYINFCIRKSAFFSSFFFFSFLREEKKSKKASITTNNIVKPKLDCSISRSLSVLEPRHYTDSTPWQWPGHA